MRSICVPQYFPMSGEDAKPPFLQQINEHQDLRAVFPVCEVEKEKLTTTWVYQLCYSWRIYELYRQSYATLLSVTLENLCLKPVTTNWDNIAVQHYSRRCLTRFLSPFYTQYRTAVLDTNV
jgi:hypothetical protein